jgi:hypothetical protein
VASGASETTERLLPAAGLPTDLSPPRFPQPEPPHNLRAAASPEPSGTNERPTDPGPPSAAPLPPSRSREGALASVRSKESVPSEDSRLARSAQSQEKPDAATEPSKPWWKRVFK